MFFTAPVKCRSGIRHFTAILVGFALDLVWIRVNAVAKWRLSAVKTNVVGGVKKFRRNFLTPLVIIFSAYVCPWLRKGGEIPLWRFLFAKLFLCACIINEKSDVCSGHFMMRRPKRMFFNRYLPLLRFCRGGRGSFFFCLLRCQLSNGKPWKLTYFEHGRSLPFFGFCFFWNTVERR